MNGLMKKLIKNQKGLAIIEYILLLAFLGGVVAFAFPNIRAEFGCTMSNLFNNVGIAFGSNNQNGDKCSINAKEKPSNPEVGSIGEGIGSNPDNSGSGGTTSQIKVTKVEITPKNPIIKINDTVTLNVKAFTSDGKDKDVSTEAILNIEDTTVATKSLNVVTGKKVGYTKISVTYENNYASIVLNVIDNNKTQTVYLFSEESENPVQDVKATLPGLNSITSINVMNDPQNNYFGGTVVSQNKTNNDLSLKLNGASSPYHSYTKDIKVTKTSTTNNFPTTLPYPEGGGVDSNNMKGTLYKQSDVQAEGGSEGDPGDSKPMTDTRSCTTGPNCTPSTINYSDAEGYKGVLTGGPEEVTDGTSTGGGTTPSNNTKTILVGPNSTNYFPSSMNYNKDGLAGTLYKKGASFEVFNGSVVNSKKANKTSFTDRWDNCGDNLFMSFTDGSFSGNLPMVNCLLLKGDSRYTPIYSGLLYSAPPYQKEAYSIEDYAYSAGPDYGCMYQTAYQNAPSTIPYDDGTYSGVLSKTERYNSGYCGSNHNAHAIILYKGTVTNKNGGPAFYQVYSGTVSRNVSTSPATITKDVQSATDSFASTIQYNENGYTGTLSKDGASFKVEIGTDTTKGKAVTEKLYGMTEGCPRTGGSKPPSTIAYDDGTYVGTLSIGTVNNGFSRYTCRVGKDDEEYGNDWDASYSGTVYPRKYEYVQSYKGTITKSSTVSSVSGVRVSASATKTYTRTYTGTVVKDGTPPTPPTGYTQVYSGKAKRDVYRYKVKVVYEMK